MTIKLKNISTRNFNGINPGEVVNVEEKLKATYIQAGFKEVKETKKEEVKEKKEVKETKKKK